MARRELLLSGKKIRGEETVALGIVDSAAHDSAKGVVEAIVFLAEKLAAKKWNGEVYASTRKSLYPELCGILSLNPTVIDSLQHLSSKDSAQVEIVFMTKAV